MNQKLMDTLRKGMNDQTRAELLKIVMESGAADDPLILELTDVELTKMINLSAYYLALATGRVMITEPTMDNGYNMAVLNEGMEELMKNPAILNYSQALIILAIALLKGNNYER